MICESCTRAATNPRTGWFNADCPECAARALAGGPEHFESKRDKRITPAYRAALEAVFGDAWKAGHERVKAWAQRLSA